VAPHSDVVTLKEKAGVVTRPFIFSFLGLAVVLTATGCGMIEMQRPTASPAPSASPAMTDGTLDNTRRMVDEGRRTFRSDTFGSEAFWGASTGGRTGTSTWA